MNAQGRPLPPLADPDTRGFWEATRSGRLVYQICQRCAEVVFPTRRHCKRCGSQDLQEHESAGLGTIYSFTVIRQHGHPFFAKRTPYVVALIDLDEGFRMLSEIVAAPKTVQVGQRVSLTWEANASVQVPLFHLVQDDAASR